MSARHTGKPVLLPSLGLMVVFAVVASRVEAQPSAGQQLRFEVATIKPAQEGPYIVEMGASHMFKAQSATLKQLAMFAYDLQDNAFAGGPDWIDKSRFDVIGKGTPPPPEDPNDPQVLRAAKERFQSMMRTLLEERFQLKLRREVRDLPVFNLLVARSGSKLKEVNGTESIRSGMGFLSGSAATTDRIARILSGQVGRKVVNQTGLDRAYDFTLTYAPDGPARNAGAPVNPPDPSRPSLVTALQEQLGLRLEASRANVEVVVVVSAERPSEN